MAFVRIAELPGILEPEARKVFIEFRVVPLSLVLTQCDSEGRVDEPCSGIARQADDAYHVVVVVFYERKYRHEQYSCKDAVSGELPDSRESPGGYWRTRLDLAAQLVIGCCDGYLD